MRPGLPGFPCGPALSPGIELPVGGEGVRTVVCVAELPPLTVWLGPPLSAPVVGATLAGAPPAPVPPAPPVVVVGAGEAGALESNDGGEVLAGVLLAGVVAGTLVSLALSSLPQPDSRAIEAAEKRSRPTRPTR
ncbi:hypothetical protein JCM12141A_48890 [Mycolicibacterium hodleri]